MPDVQKFDRTRVAAISCTPWSLHEAAKPDGVFVEKSVRDNPGTGHVVKARKMYIRQAGLDAFGYTPGCEKCQSISGRSKGETSKPHFDLCRARIMAKLAKTDEGLARVARMNDRVDRYVAERGEEGRPKCFAGEDCR